ncbi:unnamed protein product [Hydatigera taeniaeformis]|uniref:Uncharacterized protein n=1 Tax=Hydatigena taeniaeformis TaxID=6205 RepID=A0A0R3X331_HYDTA|nr:unnamed protein product [Hydatigera taeniaeformis]
MGGRESKSGSECDCCSECAALHQFHPTRVYKSSTRGLFPNPNAHQQANCCVHSPLDGSESLLITSEDTRCFPNPKANKYDLMVEQKVGNEENFSPFKATDLPSLKPSIPIETPKQSFEVSIKRQKMRVKKPTFRWISKPMSTKNVFFQGATPCEDWSPYKSHTPIQTPWPTYLRQWADQQHPNGEVKILSSTSVTESTSSEFEDMYRDFLPHECGKCITERDMMSLFEFEKLERECDVACVERLPPVPKARKIRMIQQTSEEMAAQGSIV